MKLLYEGKAKKVYESEHENEVVIYYKDDATALNGLKKGSIKEKGVMNQIITTEIFTYLEDNGIQTHFIRNLSDREQLCKKVDIIPLEVIVRNVFAGSISKRLGIKEGTPMKESIVEICYKCDELDDPLINDDHAVVLGLLTREELQEIYKQAKKINKLLITLFDEIGIRLIDFKIEFGKDYLGNIILADEISPDCCRLWDKETNEKLDKDRFRRDLGNVEDAYQEVIKRFKMKRGK